MLTRRQYANPPIQEAICQFRFSATPTWDITAASRIFEAVREEYPAKPMQQSQAGIQMSEDSNGPALRMQQSAPLVRLSSHDNGRLMLFGDAQLSVHVLRPYTDWADFRERIRTALDAYHSACEVDSVVTIGIRYVNRIALKDDLVDLDHYFNAAPAPPPGLGLSTNSFLLRQDMEKNGTGIGLVRTFGSTDTEPGETAAFILDLDATGTWQRGEVTMVRAMDKVDQVRDFEREAFESLITDSLRDVFDAS